MVNGRTSACLAEDHYPAAEDHSHNQHTRRNLTKEAKRTDKNEEHRKDSKTKVKKNP